VRVVVAEDSGLLRQMLVQVLSSRGLTVIGEATTLPELLAVVDRDPPDVVVLDIRMPPSHQDEGLQAAELIRLRHPEVGLLVLTHYAETAYAVRLLNLTDRAVGYVVKDRVQDTDRLIEAIGRVAAGEVVIDPLVVRQVLDRPRLADPLERLSPAEAQVLALVAEGYSNSGIAQKLSYSVKTVEKRVTAIAQKLDLPSVNDGRSDLNVRVLAVLTFIRGGRR
jgi:DNA-binding NarL/FixJ family response regulator